MKKQYVEYHNITKALLDNIRVGDLIMCNNWTVPLKVNAISENYFVMVRNLFGETEYSICQKTVPNWSRNYVSGTTPIIGLDNKLFNCIGDYKIPENARELLRQMEIGEFGMGMSVRSSCDLIAIKIKSDNEEKIGKQEKEGKVNENI